MGYQSYATEQNFEIDKDIAWPLKIKAWNGEETFKALTELEAEYGIKFNIRNEAEPCACCGVVSEEILRVAGIVIESKKHYYLEHLLQALSPFVKSGSFIEMRGEDGELWRYVFKDGKLKTINPEIVWED